MAAIEDQQPVEALGTDGSDESLGDRVRLRRPHRRLHDPNPLAAEDLVEGSDVLAVAVTNEEANALAGEVEAKVARLLGYPGAAGITRAAGEPDAPAAVGDEEQRVVAAQEHALDGEEIAADDARRLRVQELAPARPCAPRRRIESRPSKKTADACRRHPEAELAQLAAEPPVAPARILAREPQHQLLDLCRQRRSSAPSRRLPPLPTHKRSMPTQQRPRSNQACIACATRQVTGSCREQGPISRPELRPRDLAAEKLELVAQHEQLDVLYMQVAAATDKRTKQGPESEVEKGENHVLDPPSPRAKESRHQYWRPSRNSPTPNARGAAAVHVATSGDLTAGAVSLRYLAADHVY